MREPIGVVGLVLPWNFALLMLAWKIGPVLAASNSVIVKPAKKTTLTALRVAELAMEAGLPAGVFNVLAPCERWWCGARLMGAERAPQ